MILSRIHSRTLSAAILLLVIPLLVAGCGGGVKPVIKLYDGQSESLSVNNAIFQFVAEEGYGYSVEVVVLDTLGMQNGLPSGEIDLNLEGWQQNIPDWYAQQLVQGTIVNLRMIYEGGPQFFIIPESVAEQSGINSVQDMADHWELFRDPQDPTKGVFYNCPIGSACNKMNEVKLEAYGLDRYYNLVSPASNDALEAVLGRHQENGQAVFGFYRAPTALMGAYDWHVLEEPSYSNACRDKLAAAAEHENLRPVDQACAYQTLRIDKLAHKDLPRKAPDLVTMVRKMHVGLEPLNETLAWAMQNGIDDRKAVAVHYLRTYEDRWAGWVTREALQKIKDALAES